MQHETSPRNASSHCPQSPPKCALKTSLGFQIFIEFRIMSSFNSGSSLRDCDWFFQADEQSKEILLCVTIYLECKLLRMWVMSMSFSYAAHTRAHTNQITHADDVISADEAKTLCDGFTWICLNDKPRNVVFVFLFLFFLWDKERKCQVTLIRFNNLMSSFNRNVVFLMSTFFHEILT